MTGVVLALRADAGPEIGIGHVMRCTALAEAWQEAGGKAFLIACNLPDSVAQLLRRRRIECRELPEAATAGSGNDLERTISECDRGGADWIAIDGCHFSLELASRCKAAGLQTLWIDDLGAEVGDADLVLNQNPWAAEPGEPADRRLLLGPSYALLRSEFRFAPLRRTGILTLRALVTLGGADPGNATGSIVELLANAKRPITVKIVVGPMNRHAAELERMARAGTQIEVQESPDDLRPLFAWADVAITAAGSTCWELARFGVPMLVTTTADNQRGNAVALARLGAAIDLGPAGELTVDGVQAALEQVASAQDRDAMSLAGRRLVDGLGAGRVVEAMLAHTVRLRHARQEDCRLAFDWANDPTVRAGSFRSAPIEWNEHVAWFGHRVANHDAPFFVATDGFDRPLGQLRLDEAPAGLRISLSVDPRERRRGVGEKLLRRACRQAFNERSADCLVAAIKPGNDASRRLFERCGFSRVAKPTGFAQDAVWMTLDSTTWRRSWRTITATALTT